MGISVGRYNLMKLIPELLRAFGTVQSICVHALAGNYLASMSCRYRTCIADLDKDAQYNCSQL